MGFAAARSAFFLLLIEIFLSSAWTEISAYIAVCGKYHEFVGVFDVVNAVAVLGFCFIECGLVIDNIACAFFVILCGAIAEIFLEFSAVLFKMLLELFIRPEMIFHIGFGDAGGRCFRSG